LAILDRRFTDDPASCPSEPPLQWRDGYIKRHQVVKPNWQMFDAKDGTKFAVDTEHINRKRHFVVFYLIGGDAFDPKRLIELKPVPNARLTAKVQTAA
jgi:hypothetical protein